MWLWPSISAGITVLPVKSTRRAFAGGCLSPFLPTHVNESPSTRNAEFSIGGVLSPMIRRAPSNQIAEVLVWDERSVGKHAAARTRKQAISRRMDADSITPETPICLTPSFADVSERKQESVVGCPP